MKTTGEEAGFVTAQEMAAIFKVAVPTIRWWASKAAPGSLFAQCWRGRWHREQARLMGGSPDLLATSAFSGFEL
jgi:hypothetical protein